MAVAHAGSTLALRARRQSLIAQLADAGITDRLIARNGIRLLDRADPDRLCDFQYRVQRPADCRNADDLQSKIGD
jgi:hypothetical protein